MGDHVFEWGRGRVPNLDDSSFPFAFLCISVTIGAIIRNWTFLCKSDAVPMRGPASFSFLLNV